MSVYILIIFAFLAFAFLAFARKWHDYAMLFTIAIGCAVNANILNSMSAPVEAWGMIFSIDSILYTMFMFTVLICARDYDIRRAKILTSSAIAAILVSAVIEFFAKWSSIGYSTDLFISFFGYFASCLGTFAGVWTMLWVFKKMQNKNRNINLIFLVCVIVASVINSTIYYLGYTLVSGRIANIWQMLAGSYIGKILCIMLGQLAYFVNTHYWIPNKLKDRYPEKKTVVCVQPSPKEEQMEENKTEEKTTKEVSQKSVKRTQKTKEKSASTQTKKNPPK